MLSHTSGFILVGSLSYGAMSDIKLYVTVLFIWSIMSFSEFHGEKQSENFPITSNSNVIVMINTVDRYLVTRNLN